MDATTFELPETLGINEADRLYRQLQALLAQQMPVTFDASKVEITDTAGLQALTGFHQEAEKCGLSVKWRAPSPAMLRIAALLGLSEHLGLPQANTSR